MNWTQLGNALPAARTSRQGLAARSPDQTPREPLTRPCSGVVGRGQMPERFEHANHEAGSTA
ncbi:hypothetical protein [Kitasatospora sp. NPDC005751]|uniref:hypothetical protein n=1 Tax=unclassified Kitasatospora TaxID=2633591 RepID=UPI0033FB079A